MENNTQEKLQKLQMRLRAINKKYYMLKLQTKKLSTERKKLSALISYYNKRRKLEEIKNKN